MNDQIICPYCKKPFLASQAVSHEIKEKLQKEQEQQLADEKKRLNDEARKWREDQMIKLEERAKEKNELEMKDKTNEIEELRKQNKTLQEQLLEINKLLRQLKTEREQDQIENEKKLAKAEEIIKQQAKESAEKEYKFKILELEKKSQDAIKMAEEYKRKFEQGSQQLQGEVLELELESILKKEFPYDEIKEVPKGVTGADVLQVVKNNYGKTCGTIIWELKRTKAWSAGWVSKLKEDQRAAKADIPILISQVLPEGIKQFTHHNGVWVGGFDSIAGLGMVLRNSLIEISIVKSSVVGKDEKKEILWTYLNSREFHQRIEAIYDSMKMAREHLEKEKEFFRRKWAREEKNAQLISENLLGIHGDLQAIIGKSLPDISGMEMLPESTDVPKKTDENSLF